MKRLGVNFECIDLQKDICYFPFARSNWIWIQLLCSGLAAPVNFVIEQCSAACGLLTQRVASNKSSPAACENQPAVSSCFKPDERRSFQANCVTTARSLAGDTGL